MMSFKPQRVLEPENKYLIKEVGREWEGAGLRL